MKIIPKKVLSELQRCHTHYEKSSIIMFNILEWFKEQGYSDNDGDFQIILNEIQATGIEKYNIKALEQYLNHMK